VDKKEHASAMGAMRDIVNIFNLTRKTIENIKNSSENSPHLFKSPQLSKNFK
jgi:P2-related tail formation protein